MISEVIEKIGVAKNKALKFTVMFKRLKVKNSTKFRWWPFAGDDTYVEHDPSQWREKFTVIQEYKTDAPGRPT